MIVHELLLIVHILILEEELLLVHRDALLSQELLLQGEHGVVRLDVELELLPCHIFNDYLHK